MKFVILCLAIYGLGAFISLLIFMRKSKDAGEFILTSGLALFWPIVLPIAGRNWIRDKFKKE